LQELDRPKGSEYGHSYGEETLVRRIEGKARKCEELLDDLFPNVQRNSRTSSAIPTSTSRDREESDVKAVLRELKELRKEMAACRSSQQHILNILLHQNHSPALSPLSVATPVALPNPSVTQEDEAKNRMKELKKKLLMANLRIMELTNAHDSNQNNTDKAK